MTLAHGLNDTWYMTVRHMRNLARQPWWIAVSLVQPIVYLLLYGALFKRIVEIPGFKAGSYVDFLTPGIVVTSALYSGGWGGMGLIDDLDKGVVDRFLVTPTSRLALIGGRLVQGAIVVLIQSLIVLALGLLIGARFDGGVLGVAVLFVCAILLGTAFGALSSALALVMRREESVIAAVQFVVLPLTFLSSVFMQVNLAPGWVQSAARLNPLNWSVQAGRDAMSANVDWSAVGVHTAYLIVFGLVSAWLATRAFRTYQRSV
jgi:ABC-2 type transport system permease protein